MVRLSVADRLLQHSVLRILVLRTNPKRRSEAKSKAKLAKASDAMPVTRRAAASAEAADVAAAAGSEPKAAAPVEGCGPPPAPFTHALVVAVALLPLVVQVPVNVNIVLLPALTIYAGSWRSAKASGPPGETMTQKDAMQFPIIGRRGGARRSQVARRRSAAK